MSGSKWSLILGVLSLYSRLVQCQKYQNVSDLADVVIAVDARSTFPLFPPELNAFFTEAAKALEKMIAMDKIHVSIVQFSDSVYVLIPLRDGTNASVIANAKLDSGKAAGEMVSGLVAATVRNKTLTSEMGRRMDVPSVVIILARRYFVWDITRPTVVSWESVAKEEIEAIGVGIGTKADIVMVVGQQGIFPSLSFIVKDTLREYSSQSRDADLQFFQLAGSEIAQRLRGLLETCSYTEEVSPICYYRGDKCVANGTRRPEPKKVHSGVNYCVTNSAIIVHCKSFSECERQCNKTGKWSECEWERSDLGYQYWLPASTDPTTLFVFEACMKFHGRTNITKVCKRDRTCTCACATADPVTTGIKTTETPDQGLYCTPFKSASGFKGVITVCNPVWLTFVVTTVATMIAVQINQCINRASFKRRWDTEKRKLMETMRRSMEKKLQPASTGNGGNERKTTTTGDNTTKMERLVSLKKGYVTKRKRLVSLKKGNVTKMDSLVLKKGSVLGTPLNAPSEVVKNSYLKSTTLLPPSLTATPMDELVKAYKRTITTTRKKTTRSGPGAMEAGASKIQSKLDVSKAVTRGTMSKSEFREREKRKYLF